MIDLSVQQQGGDKWNMSAVGGKQGLYSKTLSTELSKGQHTLKIIADGKTFKREISKTIAVIESLVKVEQQVDLIARTLTIKLVPNKSAINTDMLAIEATINQTGKQAFTQAVEKKGDEWVMVVNAPRQGSSKVVNFSIMATSIQGESVSPTVLPVTVDDRLFAAPKKRVIKQEVVTNKDDIDNKEPAKVDDEDEEEQEDEVEPVNWIKTSIIVVIINLILIAVGFFAYKYIKKQAAAKQDELLSRLD
jgi:hypothetical protein